MPREIERVGEGYVSEQGSMIVISCEQLAKESCQLTKAADERGYVRGYNAAQKFARFRYEAFWWLVTSTIFTVAMWAVLYGK